MVVYCLCRKASDGDMVFCDSCNDWFHFRCLNISKKDLGEKWYRPLCSRLLALEKSILKKCALNIDKHFTKYDDRLKKLIDEKGNLNASAAENLESKLSKVLSENLLLQERCEQFRVNFVQYEANLKKLVDENGNLNASNKNLECELSKVLSENLLLKERCEQLGVNFVQYEVNLKKLVEENRNLSASTKELELKLSEVQSRNVSLERKSATLVKENEALSVEYRQLQQNLKQQAKGNASPSSSQSSNITNFSQKRKRLSLSSSQQAPKMFEKKKKRYIDDSD